MKEDKFRGYSGHENAYVTGISIGNFFFISSFIVTVVIKFQFHFRARKWEAEQFVVRLTRVVDEKFQSSTEGLKRIHLDVSNFEFVSKCERNSFCICVK